MKTKVRIAYVLLIIFNLICASFIFGGCAGLRNMKPEDRRLKLCYDFMNEHEKFDRQSAEILADPKATVETKKFVAEKIDPVSNDLFPLIVDYCKAALNGGTPSAVEINETIAHISTLFARIGK